MTDVDAGRLAEEELSRILQEVSPDEVPFARVFLERADPGDGSTRPFATPGGGFERGYGGFFAKALVAVARQLLSAAKAGEALEALDDAIDRPLRVLPDADPSQQLVRSLTAEGWSEGDASRVAGWLLQGGERLAVSLADAAARRESTVLDARARRELRDVLADLFDNPRRAVAVAVEAGIPPASLPQAGAAGQQWFEILEEARKHGLVGAVVRVALVEYPTNPDLRRWIRRHGLQV